MDLSTALQLAAGDVSVILHITELELRALQTACPDQGAGFTVNQAIRYAIWIAAGAPEHIARTLAKDPDHSLAVPLANAALGVLYQEAHPTLAQAGLTRSKR